jgi:acetoin utilization protein AcuB
MLVSMWMTRDPVTVAPESAVSDAAALMSRRRLRHLPVTRGTRLVGIVSAHDVARAYPPDLNPFSLVAMDQPIRRPIAEIMSAAVRTVGPDTPIEDAARLLHLHKIGALPVVARNGLVGIVTEADVFRAFREITGAGEPGVRITFDVTDGEDVIGEVLALGRRHGLVSASVFVMHHDHRRIAAARLLGSAVDGFVEEIWRSGHRVLALLRDGVPVAPASPSSAGGAPAPPPASSAPR